MGADINEHLPLGLIIVALFVATMRGAQSSRVGGYRPDNAGVHPERQPSNPGSSSHRGTR